QNRLIRQVVDDAVHGAAVAVVVVPGSPAHLRQNVHGSVLVRHHAVRRAQASINVIVPVQAGLLTVVGIVAGLDGQVGTPLVIRGGRLRRDVRVTVVVGNHTLTAASIVVRLIRSVNPLPDRALPGRIGDDIVIGSVGGVVK